MKKYICDICHHIYDPELGEPEQEIAPGTPFEKLPEGWICPICGESKIAFDPVEE